MPTLAQVRQCFERLDLSCDHIANDQGDLTGLGRALFGYFQHRANALWEVARPNLMHAAEAKQLFEHWREALNPNCPLPMNKQKGGMKAPAYLTSLVNMLIEAGVGDIGCDYDPQTLTTVTRDRQPLRTLARRVDGAFPSAVNPIALWEIKEYYYTTTFGSRVADGVYETLLDGMELAELDRAEGRHIHHLLVIDGQLTWWQQGRAYLCRIVDMLHMGYVDEVLFGREVIEKLPEIASDWREEWGQIAANPDNPEKKVC